MRADDWRGDQRRRVWERAFGLFLVMVCWPVWGPEGQMQRPRQNGQQAWVRVTVERGELSVDLRNADVRQVLEQIRKQTGNTVHVASAVRATISTQFTGVELGQGLRRLLRLASLSYTILYA